MAFQIDPKKTGDLNSGAFNPLKVGTHTYKITACKLVPDKQDGSGKRKQIEVQLLNGSKKYRVFLSVESENDTVAEIATKTLVSLCAAAGYKGVINAASLVKIVGKSVDIDAAQTTKGTKTYTNARAIYAEGEGTEDSDETEDDEPEEEEEEAEEETEEESDEAEAEDEEDEEEEEEEPAPKAKTRAKPWG